MLTQLRNPTDATSRLLLATWVGMLGGVCPSPCPPPPAHHPHCIIVTTVPLVDYLCIP